MRSLLALPLQVSLLQLLGELLEHLMNGTELFEDRRRLLAIARGVIRGIHRVYDLKLHLVILCHRQRVERPIDTINSKQVK